jgi:hypothetical protein
MPAAIARATPATNSKHASKMPYAVTPRRGERNKTARSTIDRNREKYVRPERRNSMFMSR